MLFNEKYGISHINFSTGWISIDAADDEFSYSETDSFEGLIRGFSRLIGGERESLGMMQYRITNSPYDFVFQWDNAQGIIIVAEDIGKIDSIVKYIKNSLSEINYNMLYEERM